MFYCKQENYSIRYEEYKFQFNWNVYNGPLEDRRRERKSH